ncbi:MAG: hypothetical protein ACRDSJ_08220 [Rubrobacteraceae bacterium]
MEEQSRPKSGEREIRLEERLQPPSRAHPFGPDHLGLDLFARVIVVTPVSLALGLTAAAVSLVLGFTAGGFAGYPGERRPPALPFRRGRALLLPPSPAAIILAIGPTIWPSDARAEILKARNLEGGVVDGGA